MISRFFTVSTKTEGLTSAGALAATPTLWVKNLLTDKTPLTSVHYWGAITAPPVTPMHVSGSVLVVDSITELGNSISR